MPLRPMAWNQGYIDIQVSAPEVDYQPDGIVIKFTVHEGPRYKVREAKICRRYY